MTHNEKLYLYRAGKYVFSVPPVFSGNWDDAAWITWIDGCNGWRPDSAGYTVKP